MEKKDELLKALARCRVIDSKTIELLGLTESLAISCMSEKLVGQEVKNGHSFYTLSTKGEQYIKQEIPEIKQIYRGFNAEQDLALMEHYAKLEPQLRDTWITKDDFIVKHQLAGTVDGAYVNDDGEIVAVKVLSNQASYSAVEKVEHFLKQAELNHIHYIIYKSS